jgi:hypothetical protein
MERDRGEVINAGIGTFEVIPLTPGQLKPDSAIRR